MMIFDWRPLPAAADLRTVMRGRGRRQIRSCRLTALLFISTIALLFVAIVGASPVHQNESISLENNEIGEELEMEAATALESNRRGLYYNITLYAQF